MAKAFDGSYAPDKLPALPCGGIPYFDNDSGYAYRCDSCMAVIGSVGMPKDCKDAYDKANNVG
jgi:hypothetical protein